MRELIYLLICTTLGGQASANDENASATVFINGKPAGRIGDAIDCGDNAQTGSVNVFRRGYRTKSRGVGKTR